MAITVDGEPVEAYLGETVAAVLMARGDAELRRTRHGASRGLYCGMGLCFECLVMVNGVANVRACMTWANDGMEVRHMAGLVPAEAGKESD